MATVTLPFTSKVYIPINPGCCSEVFICLDPSWVSKTVSGTQLVVGTLENAGRQLSKGKLFSNARCIDVYQYSITIDLSQFLDDINRVPYTPTCSDINEIMPYACTVQSILDIVEAGSVSNRLCLTALTEFPDNPTKNCIVNMVDGIDPDSLAPIPDGLYVYNGSHWVTLIED